MAGLCWCALVVTALISTPSASFASSEKIPRVLSDADIERYQQIFDLQASADWRGADALIKALENKSLLGHVQFQRYMHPTGYRSSYRELSGWLQTYNDLPGAGQIYALAKRRQGRARAPQRPAETRYPGVTGQSSVPRQAGDRRSAEERRIVLTFKSDVARYVRRGEPDRAEKRYHAMAARDLLTKSEAASALERIAASYYYNGDDFKALVIAQLATTLDRESEPEADWIAGLASWRRGDLESALEHFDHVGRSAQASRWLASAGHFWASRVARRLGNGALAHNHLLKAAQSNETFYGLIANRQLGIVPEYNWTPPELTDKDLNTLLKNPAVVRAIALTEVGRDDLADEELRLLWGRKGTSVQNELLAFGAALNLPALQVRLGRAGGTGKPVPAAVRYPLPDWEPVDGLRIDRALLFAIVKKESDFRSRARSGKDARGLMQVMPATASWISRDSSLFRRNKNRLYEPEYNMALGQQYIELLLSEDYVEDNLFMLLAAYNGGPGSLIGWRKSVEYEQDPLLFIESIGFHQTRDYIERVMTNMWLYRIRLQQDTPSLDAIASGAWPALDELDTPDARRIREHRRARLAARERQYQEDE